MHLLICKSRAFPGTLDIIGKGYFNPIIGEISVVSFNSHILQVAQGRAPLDLSIAMIFRAVIIVMDAIVAEYPGNSPVKAGHDLYSIFSAFRKLRAMFDKKKRVDTNAVRCAVARGNDLDAAAYAPDVHRCRAAYMARSG